MSMNDIDKEALSALVDDQCDTFSLRRLLSSSDENAIRQTWHSYHLVQQVMHKNGSDDFLNVDLSQRISDALDEEAQEKSISDTLPKRPVIDNQTHHVDAVTTKEKQNWIRGAVAASVAVAVVIGTGGLGGFSINSPTDSVDDYLASKQTSAPIISPISQLTSSAQTSGVLHTVSATTDSRIKKDSSTEPSINKPSLDSRYNHYLLQHVEQTSLNGGQGMMNYARMGDYQDF